MDFVELWAKWYDTRIRFKAKLIVWLKNGPTALHKTTRIPCFKFSATSNGTEIVAYLYLYVYLTCGLRVVLGTIHGTNWKYTLITRRICIVRRGSPLARTASCWILVKGKENRLQRQEEQTGECWPIVGRFYITAEWSSRENIFAREF